MRDVARRLRSVGPGDATASFGTLLLRVFAGGLILTVHGWHKLLGGIAYVRDGTNWPLLSEVAELHVPHPVAAAWIATGVQIVSAALLALGFHTRICAILLVGTLAGAIAHNLVTGRSPELALLYAVMLASLALLGGGRHSLDARHSTTRAMR